MIPELMWFMKAYTTVWFIPAILFLAWSFYFSLARSKFKELKNIKSVTWWIALGMFGSLLIILIEGNFLIFHRPWGGFLTAALLVSALVSAALKIGYYKTPISIPEDLRGRDTTAYVKIRHIQDEAEITETKSRHGDKLPISAWDVEKRRMETS